MSSQCQLPRTLLRKRRMFTSPVLTPNKGLGWRGSQINFSSGAKALEAASTKPRVSPRREGHTLNPKLGHAPIQMDKQYTSAAPC